MYTHMHTKGRYFAGIMHFEYGEFDCTMYMYVCTYIDAYIK